jgi:enoyl-CoA hydratase/carnithine racemase
VGDYETLLYEETDGVAVVTMNRPEVLNCFNLKMQHELRDVWTSLRRNEGVNAAVLTGAGDEAFCTGIDRDESIEAYLADPEGKSGVAGRTGRVSSPFMFDSPGPFINPKQCDLWKPVVAAVNGIACAGALYMLGECDVIIAADHATFFDPHVTYGMVSGYESIHLLQKLPLGETLRLALMGANERISAQRAHQVGLVSEVVPKDQLRERALHVGRTIASAPPLAVQATLRTIWMAHENSRRHAIDMAPMFVGLGTTRENLAKGEAIFRGERGEHEIR